jgi:hypothetical protein
LYLPAGSLPFSQRFVAGEIEIGAEVRRLDVLLN